MESGRAGDLRERFPAVGTAGAKALRWDTRWLEQQEAVFVAAVRGD